MVARENENVRLYPMKVEGSGYIYNGMILEVDGKVQEFSDWQGEGGSYKPEVHELDLKWTARKKLLFCTQKVMEQVFIWDKHVSLIR